MSNENPKDSYDSVNRPFHYNQHESGIECITITRQLNYDLGCAIKYLWRSKLKKQSN